MREPNDEIIISGVAPIYIVGVNIDALSARSAVSLGELTRIKREIYVNPDYDLDDVILRNAVRIADHLYPRAYLSSLSAILLGPSEAGRLFLSGRRNLRTRLGPLEIVQVVAPDSQCTVPVAILDDLGMFPVLVSDPCQNLLEAYRLRSEHGSAIPDSLRAQLAARLIHECGSVEEAVARLADVASTLGWSAEYHQAQYLLTLFKGRAWCREQGAFAEFEH